MTNPRQGRRREAVFFGFRASSLTAAAALTGALLLPAGAWAAPHSHAHRALPTALHTSTIMDTGTHAGKKGKHGINSRVEAVPGSAAGRRGSGAKGKGKPGKGRGRQSEPVEDVVPMYRAGREDLRPGSKGARVATSGGRNRRKGGFTAGPAPLVSRDSHGHGHMLTASHGMPMREPARENRGVTRWKASDAAMPDRSLSGRNAAEDRRVGVPATVASVSRSTTRSEVFAQGVSRPDDDERLPRLQDKDAAAAGSEAGGGTPAPVVRISAAPPVTLPKSGVVQGFGGEIAVPPSDSSTRPGGTRRRNHPSTWSDPSAVLRAEPLEEREALTDAAVTPAVLPDLYDRNGRLMMPAPLKGSHDVLVHQNLMADNDGLERIHDDADLDRLRAAHLLVNLPSSESLHVNDDLPANRRVARPWTAMFAVELGRAFYARFREPIYLTSAARTVQYQARLQMVNGNAAGLWGDTASPHLTGQAVDLAKRGMSNAELAWMRGYLQPLMQAGKIDVEEEFHQSCFHVSVYRSYAAGRRMPQHEVAQVHVAGPVEGSVPVDAPEDK